MIGDKDQDGFYWGELRGRRGFVPHNMVSEIDENQAGLQGTNTSGTIGTIGMGRNTTGTGSGLQQSVRNVSRERWGDIYCNMPVKRMIALYDYDPQELSPNVDAEVRLNNSIIYYTVILANTHTFTLKLTLSQKN